MSEQNPSLHVRKRGPEPVARHALGLLKGHLAKRGFAQIELVTRWPEIAGTELSVHCVPLKFSVTASGAAVLSLLADDRAALELQHQTPKLIDKINRYFGYAAVSKIKVIAGDIPKPRIRPTVRPLSAGEESELLSWTSQVSDPDLREALTRLGRNALAESRKTAILKR